MPCPGFSNEHYTSATTEGPNRWAFVRLLDSSVDTIASECPLSRAVHEEICGRRAGCRDRQGLSQSHSAVLHTSPRIERN